MYQAHIYQDNFQWLEYTLKSWFSRPKQSKSDKSEKNPTERVACLMILCSCVSTSPEVLTQMHQVALVTEETALAQLKDNQRLSYCQENLPPESQRIFVRHLLS